MVQHMRLSQFVITYGPGSIIETVHGPRLIPLADRGLSHAGVRFENFEISDRRMSEILLGGGRIFRIPSNAELNIPRDDYIYRTIPFPSWKLCHNRMSHQGGMSVLFQGEKCPVCGSHERFHMEPVRFVLACNDGHLDDVNWDRVIHKGNIRNHSQFFLWKGGGGSLTGVILICPRCREQVSLGDAYRNDWPCTGRYPEREYPGGTPLYSSCSNHARMILRQASNLRIPEIRTLFTVPPCYLKLHSLLELIPVRSALAVAKPASYDDFRGMIEALGKCGLISPGQMRELLSFSWQEILKAMEEIERPLPGGYSGLLIEEFRAFITGSEEGIPPVSRPGRRSHPLIEIDPNRVVRVKVKNLRMKVVPVSKLRTVIVQVGYRREIRTDSPATVVPVCHADPSDPSRGWYPGIEFFGEGIFFMLDGEGWHFPLEETRTLKAWKAAEKHPYPQNVFRDPGRREELHPVFVWWHTLSHLLIRSISLEAGYSASSIRERVYIEISGKGVRGGILLYTVQPGSDGTLGGLVSLVEGNKMSRIFMRVMNQLEICSTDPLCFENDFDPGRYSGAACYACLFLPETSCEHRNMWLDRKILLENIP